VLAAVLREGRAIKFGRKPQLTQHQIADGIKKRNAGEPPTEIAKTCAAVIRRYHGSEDLSLPYHPLGFCKTHGVFPVRTIEISDATNSAFVGCETNCPMCNAMGEIIPGTYSKTAEGLNVLLDPSISPDALAAIRDIAERARAGKITPEQAKSEAEHIKPGLGKLFDIGNWSDQAIATLYQGVIVAVGAIIAARIALSPSPNIEVTPIVERVIERVIEPQVTKNHLRSSSSLSSHKHHPKTQGKPPPKPTKPTGKPGKKSPPASR
jgi:hypothetical protein